MNPIYIGLKGLSAKTPKEFVKKRQFEEGGNEYHYIFSQ